MKLGDRFLFPGGWHSSGGGGHFILYEIMATQYGFILNLYNTGSGTNLYHAASHIYGKKYINPVYTVSEIPLNRISSRAFLRFMIAMKNKLFTGKASQQVTAKDIYEKLIRILGFNYFYNQDVQQVTPQNSGTCSSKAILAFLKNRLPSKIYFNLLYQLKFFCLANFISSKKSPINQTEIRLLQKAAHGLANLGRKIYSSTYSQEPNKPIDKEEMERLLHLYILCEKTLSIANISLPSPLTQNISQTNKIEDKYKLDALDELDSSLERSSSSQKTARSTSTAAPAAEGTMLKTRKKKGKSKKEDKFLNLDVPPRQLSLAQNAATFFQNWSDYFRKASATAHVHFALNNLELMLEELPIELDLSKCTPKDKMNIFRSLTSLAKNYHKESEPTEVLRVNVNLWHLFAIMSCICKESLINDGINFEKYSFNFKMATIYNGWQIAAQDLTAQKRHKLLSNYFDKLNKGKALFIFDTISSKRKIASFSITEEDYQNFADFTFIKEYLELSQSNHSSSNSKFLENILDVYTKEGLPKIYYELRQVYFYCIFSTDHNLKGDYCKPINIKYEKQADSPLYHLYFCPSRKDNIEKFPIDYSVSAGSFKESFFKLNNFISGLIESPKAQNEIRAMPKQSCIDQNTLYWKYGHTSLEVSSISKCEINRIIDIYNSKSERLILAINYYRENPHFLEKVIHLEFLQYIFYELTSFEKNYNPLLSVEFNKFIKTLFAIYEFPDQNQHNIISFLFTISFDFLTYISYADRDLCLLLKNEALKRYNAIKIDSSKNVVNNIVKIDSSKNILNTIVKINSSEVNYYESVLAALAFSESLTQDEIVLALSVALEIHNKDRIWDKKTTPLLNKILDALNNPSHRNAILNDVKSISQNIDFSSDTSWKQDENDKFKFKCQGWTFNLFRGSFTHPDQPTLQSVLYFMVGGNSEGGSLSLLEVLGDVYKSLILKDGNWTNPEETVRIVKSHEKYEVHKIIDNEWHRFCFASNNLQKALPGLPKSLNPSTKRTLKKYRENIDERKARKRNENNIVQNMVLWYQPLDSEGGLFLGINEKDQIVLRCEKTNKKWRIEDATTTWVYGKIDAMPSPLIPITHFPKQLIEAMQLWLDKDSKEIQKIHIPSFIHLKNPLLITKENDHYIIEGYEGFRISEELFESPFRSFPPLLTLKNQQESSYLLIPNTEMHIEERGKKNDALFLKVRFATPEINYDNIVSNNEIVNIDIPSFFLFEYDYRSNTLVASNLNSCIFLSYLYFVDQNYEMAYQLLEKCAQKMPYAKEQAHLFARFISYSYNYQSYINSPLHVAILAKIFMIVYQAQKFTSIPKSDKKDNRSEFERWIKKYFNISRTSQEEIIEKYFMFWNAIPKHCRLSQQEDLIMKDWISDPQHKEGMSQFLRIKELGDSTSHPVFDDLPTLTNLWITSHCPLSTKNNLISNLEHYNYNQSMQKLQNLRLNSLLNNGLENIIDINIIRTLIMGSLSDNPEDSTCAIAHILFIKFNAICRKSLKGIADSELFSFLNFIVYYREEIKQTLSANNIIIDWNNPDPNAYHILIKALQDHFQIDRVSSLTNKPLISKPFGEFQQTIFHRKMGTLNFSKIPEPHTSLLLPYNKNIKQIQQNLQKERQDLCAEFLKLSKDTRRIIFMPSYNDSRADELLNALPIAQELYDSFREVIDVIDTKWSLCNPKEEKVSIILDHLLSKVQANKALKIQEAALLKKTLAKDANASRLEEGIGLDISNLQAAVERKINIFSHQSQAITISDLVLWVLGKTWKSLSKSNPFLSNQDAQGILKKTLEWMLLETELEIHIKTEKILQDLLKECRTGEIKHVSSALEQIGTLLSSVRHYEVIEKPNFLAFEYLTRLTLRKQQVEKIEQCLSSPQSHQILKLMMGEGKSKVILPFLAKLLANGKTFPIVIAPQVLYQEYLKNLKASCEQNLSQSVFTFTFCRSSSTAAKDTDLLLQMLKSAIQEKGVLLITAETIRALFLKYQELLVIEKESKIKGTVQATSSIPDSAPLVNMGQKLSLLFGFEDDAFDHLPAQEISRKPDSELPITEIIERRLKLGEIINIIRQTGFALMDEGHIALNSLIEMNFTLSGNEPLNEREITILIKIYKELIGIKFNFTSPLQIDLSEEETANFSTERNELIKRLYPNNLLVRQYLEGIKPEYYSEIKKSDPDFAAELALVKEQIWKLLPFTLSKSLNHRYGRNLNNPDIEYAIPYLGAQKPSPLSEFGHKYVMINYTIQMHIQEGLKLNQFKTWTQKLKKKWIRVMARNSEAEADSIVKQFLGDVPFKELDLKDTQVLTSLYNRFAKNQNIIFDYLEDILLPNLKFPPKKLNSNEQDLGDFFFTHVLALSGTPYNAKTYPSPFQLTEANESYFDDDPGMQALFNASKTGARLTDEEKKLMYALSLPKNQTIMTSKTESCESALNAIKEQREKIGMKLCAFVDLGAYFKDYSNLQTANLILETVKDVKGVVFFDDSSNTLMILPRGSDKAENYVEGKLPLHQIFAFFDNVHTFAADIPLQEEAHALISFNQESCLYELLQAAKRMRKLEKSQTVSYLISDSIKERLTHLVSPYAFNVAAIYLHAIINESRSLGKQIERSTMHQLRHLIKKEYLIKQLKSIHNLGLPEKILVEDNHFAPSGYFSKKAAPATIFNNYFKTVSHLAPSLLENSYEQPWERIIQRAKMLLPDEIESEGCGDLNREVEKQEEKKIELFVDKSTSFEPWQEESWPPKDILNFIPNLCDIQTTLNDPNEGSLILYRLDNYMQTIENQKIPLFDNSILMTRNFAKTSQFDIIKWDIPIKPVDYFVQVYHKDQEGYDHYYYVIITLKEMETLKLYINLLSVLQINNRPFVTLFSIQGQTIAGDIIPENSDWPQFKKALVQMKFFDGREDFSKAEEPDLRSWIRDKELLITELFAKLHQNREKNEDYGKGSLFRILNETVDARRSQMAAHVHQNTLALQDNSHSNAKKRPRSENERSWSEEEGMQIESDTDEPVLKRSKNQ